MLVQPHRLPDRGAVIAIMGPYRHPSVPVRLALKTHSLALRLVAMGPIGDRFCCLSLAIPK